MSYDNDRDPFAGGDSVPALSFKDEPIGTVKTITVTEPAKMLHSRDYDSGDLAYWDKDKRGKIVTHDTGQPVMAAVVNGTDANGDEVSVWARKPSSLFTAIKDAQAAVKPGYRLKAGDKLHIKFSGEEPPKSGRGNNRKLYVAKIEPAPEPPPADAFGDDPWSSAPSSPAAPPAQLGDEPPF